MNIYELEKKLDSRPVVIDLDTNNPVALEDQARSLVEDAYTDRGWCALGFEDEDGFAEVMALAHPNYAWILKHYRNNFRRVLEFLHTLGDAWGPDEGRHASHAIIVNQLPGLLKELEEVEV